MTLEVRELFLTNGTRLIANIELPIDPMSQTLTLNNPHELTSHFDPLSAEQLFYPFFDYLPASETKDLTLPRDDISCIKIINDRFKELYRQLLTDRPAQPDLLKPETCLQLPD